MLTFSATKACETCGTAFTVTNPKAAKRRFCSNRCRKRQYDLVCVGCGGRVDGTTPGKMPDRDNPVCAACAGAHYAKWTPETVVAAIQRFAERYGRPPAAPDFDTSHARSLGHDWRAERFHADGDYPVATSVTYVFGTWNAAIEAAGFATRRGGQYPRARRLGAHLAQERA
jgi:hypothetical protein